jgi:alpha-L-rhamnosidase
MEDIGAYNTFLFVEALASLPAGDDGSAMLTALTKCDNTSWCAEWEQWNATMTMEAFPEAVVSLTSFSHPWGTSAINGIVHGLIGIEQTSPGYASFTVRPRLGGLKHASIKLPTLFGFINATATPTSLSLNVPCNTLAKACLILPAGQRVDYHGELGREPLPRLMMDGNPVAAVREGWHLCTETPVSCGTRGADRQLAL